MSTLAAAIAAFLADPAAGRMPRTVATRRRSLTILATWCAGQAIDHPGGLDGPACLAFQRWLATARTRRGGVYSLLSQFTVLSDLRAFGRWLLRAGIVTVDPATVIVLPRLPQALPGMILTPEQQARLLAGPDVTTPLGLRDRAMLELAAAVALNGRELAALLVADVDERRSAIHVRAWSSRRARELPLSASALDWLQRYQRDARPILAAGGHRCTVSWRRPRVVDQASRASPVLFLSQWGAPLEHSDISWACTKHARAAGLPPRRILSALRDTLAVRLIEGGLDVRYLAALFGHVDLQGVRKYVALNLRHLQAVHARCHPAEQTGSLPSTREHAQP